MLPKAVSSWRDGDRCLGRRQCVTIWADYVSTRRTSSPPRRAALMEASDVPGESGDPRALSRSGDDLPDRLAAAESAVHPACEKNFVDSTSATKLVRLGIRRASRSTIHVSAARVVRHDRTLPTAVEAKKFLQDQSPRQTQPLIDEFSVAPNTPINWAMKWADILRADKSRSRRRERSP